MTTAREKGWKAHEEQQRRVWLRLTPAQRLAWLEEAKQFAEIAQRARKASRASPTPEAR